MLPRCLSIGLILPAMVRGGVNRWLAFCLRLSLGFVADRGGGWSVGWIWMCLRVEHRSDASALVPTGRKLCVAGHRSSAPLPVHQRSGGTRRAIKQRISCLRDHHRDSNLDPGDRNHEAWRSVNDLGERRSFMPRGAGCPFELAGQFCDGAASPSSSRERLRATRTGFLRGEPR
jgi:hypothetical protein